MDGLKRDVPGTPFVPSEGPELHRRCAEIFGIQCAGLAKRIERLSSGPTLNIGISGGLDSTLALLVAVTTCDMLGIDRRSVYGLTMPGFGTTERTRTNALALMQHLGISSETIDIRALALRSLSGIGPFPFRNRLQRQRCRIVPCRSGQRAREKPATTSRSRTSRPGCGPSCSCPGASSSAPATFPSWHSVGPLIMATI